MNIESFLQQLCQHCGVEVESEQISLEEDSGTLKIQLDLDQDDSGLFIGSHGETLDSLQRLVRVLFMDEYPETKIALNINNYREQREEKLEDMAYSIAQRVIDTGQPYTFRSFMPAYERFIIHSTISDNTDFESLESVSEGEGKYRRLTIQKK